MDKMKGNIIKVYTESNGEINIKKRKEKYFKEYNIDLYEHIINYSKYSNAPFIQKIWRYLNNIAEDPKCKECKIENVKWNSFKYGYRNFCSTKCSFKSPLRLEKSKETNLKKHGSEYSFQSEEVKDKIKKTNLKKYGHENVSKSDIIKEKVKKTNLERYGHEHIMKSEKTKDSIKYNNLKKYGYEYTFQVEKYKKKSKETNLKKYGFIYATQSNKIKDYIKKTNLERYGTEYPSQNKNIIEKAKKTNLKRYGHENAAHGKEAKQKIKETNLERYGQYHAMKSVKIKEKIKETNLIKIKNNILSLNIIEHNIIKISNNLNIIKCNKCKENYEASYYFLWQRIKKYKTVPCTNCNPVSSSSSSGKELELLKFIQDNYTDIIIQSDREILKGKELDIYLPGLGLAIEFNGLYWHSELFKEKNYHLKKTEDCLKKNIHLIHIWEDDWDNKKDLVKSVISNLLGKSKRIYARKTETREVSSRISKEFLINNHIQGNVNSKIRLGLYYENILVCLMTFGSLRKNLGQNAKEGSYELLRFCNIKGYSVIGGASKLLKEFEKTENLVNLISYCNKDFSKGNLYYKLNFKFDSYVNSNYHYIINGIRENRFKYRKDVLVKEGYNPSLTEHQIMLNRNFNRIYNSGSIKFLKKY